MNYFAHGRHFIDNPYFMAGTAVPDWLNVVNRRAKARSKTARTFVDDPDPAVAAVAAGIVQHHFDDAWFHQTRAFAELSLQFSLAIRSLLEADTGFRPSFLGHILVELLLDAALVDEQPGMLDRYYQAIDQVDPVVVTRAVEAIATDSVASLAMLIPRFSTERFLYDYADDERLLFRLNNVMRRVRLPSLPEEITSLFPEARRSVRRRKAELLSADQLPQADQDPTAVGNANE